jgi:peptidoglycan-associated lipoprotein
MTDVAVLAFKALLLATSLPLSACNATGAKGDIGQTGHDACSGERGSGLLYDANLGDPCDPTSIAYFNRVYGNQVFFDEDQSELTSEGRADLAGQAQWLIKNENYGVVIEGHADEQGSLDYNFELGGQRAAAVQSFLIEQGVSTGRLRIISYGNERPIERCSVEACYAKNRRVVTVLSLGERT